MSAATILFLAANPMPSKSLELDREMRTIQERVNRRTCRVDLDLQICPAVRIHDIRRALNELHPAIVHFSGHGVGPSGLMLHDEDGNSKLVDALSLRKMLEPFKHFIRIVVLNACYSEEQAKEIGREIECVIGMSSAIGDRAATDFSASFYEALAFGCDVDTSFLQGLTYMQANGTNGHEIPRLIVRRGSDASKIALPVNGHSVSPAERSDLRDVVAPVPQGPATDNETRKVVVTLEALISEITPELLIGLAEILRDRTGDLGLRITKIEAGSVILTIETTESGRRRLVELYESGELRELAGIKVRSLQAKVPSTDQRAAIAAASLHAEYRVAVGGSGAAVLETSDRARWLASGSPELSDKELRLAHGTGEAIAGDGAGASDSSALAQLEFGKLIAGFRPAMTERAKRLCRGHADADDVVQDALERALRTAKRPRDPGDPAKVCAWLLKIVVHTFIDRMRKRTQARRHITLEIDLADAPADEPTEALPWEDISDEDVRDAVGRLSGDVRDTYLLFASSGLTYQEISTRLGIPTTTVATRIHRAREQLLRKLLAKTMEKGR